MVTRTDIEKAARLNIEYRQLTQAHAALEAGARIVGLTLARGGPPASGPGGPMLNVRTYGMEYPETMVKAIKAAFAARQKEIAKELKDLGVSDT